jgi:hypothetical protein
MGTPPHVGNVGTHEDSGHRIVSIAPLLCLRVDPLLLFLVAVSFHPVEFPLYPLIIVLLAPPLLPVIVVLLVPSLLLIIVSLLVPSFSSSSSLGLGSTACHSFYVTMSISFKLRYIVHIPTFSGIL